jgi:hypothetical protein
MLTDAFWNLYELVQFPYSPPVVLLEVEGFFDLVHTENAYGQGGGNFEVTNHFEKLQSIGCIS